jgi:hypothetical protein
MAPELWIVSMMNGAAFSLIFQISVFPRFSIAFIERLLKVFTNADSSSIHEILLAVLPERFEPSRKERFLQPAKARSSDALKVQSTPTSSVPLYQ